MSLKNQIQELVSAARTEDALKILAQKSQDAVLLQARFANGKRQYLNGLLDGGEWFRIQNQVNFAVLELAEQLQTSSENGTGGGNFGNSSGSFSQQNVPSAQPAGIQKPKVFISYNHADTSFAEKVHYFLKAEDCITRIDFEDMGAAQGIEDFINSSIKWCDMVVMLVSKNSLRSAWVSQEASITQTLEKVSSKILIPVSLDNSVFDPDFYFESIDEINGKISKTNERIQKSISMNIDFRPFQDDVNRYLDAKNNLGSIIEKLKSILVVEIDGDKFNSGMKRVLKRIKNQNTNQ